MSTTSTNEKKGSILFIFSKAAAARQASGRRAFGGPYWFPTTIQVFCGSVDRALRCRGEDNVCFCAPLGVRRAPWIDAGPPAASRLRTAVAAAAAAAADLTRPEGFSGVPLAVGALRWLGLDPPGTLAAHPPPRRWSSLQGRDTF